MPKVTNTHDERKRNLFKRITPEHLFTNTIVFERHPSEPAFDPATVEAIKRNYRLYFESWLKEDAEKFLIDKK